MDITNNDGFTFKQIDKESFHVVKRSKKGIKTFFAGSNGKIAELNLD